MQPLLDRLYATPRNTKIGLLALLVAGTVAGYYSLVYVDLMEQKSRLLREAQRLNEERRDSQRREQDYAAFRAKQQSLVEKQRELLRALPKLDDIEQFIESVQAQVELAGLSKVTSVREADQPGDLYVKIPVRMSLVGSYHQINQFFRSVGELQRIVNIEDLSLEPVSEGALAGSNLLKANFIAATFQFVDQAGKAPRPAERVQ